MSEQEPEPTSEHTTVPVSLAEKVETLRTAGKSNEEIVKAIFEENMDTPTEEICQLLNMDKMDVGRIKGRVSRWKGKKPKGTIPPPETVYKTEPDPNSILDEILTKHPDVPAKVKDEIMDWAKMKGMLHPQEVAWLLSNMKGLANNTANIIAQKYALAVQKAQAEGKTNFTAPMFAGQMPGQTQQGGFGFGFPPGYGAPMGPSGSQQQQQQQPVIGPTGSPYPWPYGPYYGQPQAGQPQQPSQDVRSVVKDEIRDFMDKITEKLKPKETIELMVEIEDPVKDDEGKFILDGEGRPIVRKMRVPASQASRFAPPAEDVEAKMLARFKLQKDLFKSDITPETLESTVRKIVREEAPPRTDHEKGEPPLKAEDVKRAAAEAASEAVKSYVDEAEKEKRETEKERRNDDRFNRLETAIRDSSSARAVEGYKEDAYRVFGQGMTEVSSTARELMKDRKPLEVLIKDGAPILFGVRPPKELAAANTSDEAKFFDRLGKQGFVVDH